jgi:arylsulfatase A-like enzyme
MQPLGLLSRVRIALPLIWIAAGLCLARAGADGEPPRTPVILISIDTLRADHLSAYGYTRIHTAGIDSYAQPGTLFTAVDAQVPLTLPSHASLFTSTYPFENRIEENAQPVPPGAVTLASVLRAHGYHTAAFIGSVFLERQMGLDQGFELYDSPFSFEAFSPLSGSMFFTGESVNRYAVRDRRAAALVVHAAERWLRDQRGQPVFLFVHLFDLHTPYAIAPGERPTGLSGYDSELQYVDQQLGWFQRALIEGGWWDRSLVVLLSDHGEGLGEHGEATHGYFVYQSTLAVPLLLHWPAATPSRPARAPLSCGLIDVAPTILDFLHLPAPRSFEGRSLLAALDPAARESPGAVYSETLYTHDAFGWAPLRAVRLGAYKYIDAPTPELYNLLADPREQNNLLRSAPAPGAEKAAEKAAAEAKRLRGELARLLARASPEPSVPPSGVAPGTRALLTSLGYLSAAARPGAGHAGPDPKDRVAEIRLYENANLLLAERRFDEAGAILRNLLTRDPHNTLARRDLGLCHLARGHYSEARTCFQQVLAAAPRDFLTRFQLGLAEQHLGLYQAALEDISAACEIAPQAETCRTKLQELKNKTK